MLAEADKRLVDRDSSIPGQEKGKKRCLERMALSGFRVGLGAEYDRREAGVSLISGSLQVTLWR